MKTHDTWVSIHGLHGLPGSGAVASVVVPSHCGKLAIIKINYRITYHTYGKGSQAHNTKEHKDDPVAVEQGIDTKSENCCATNKPY
jgi:hypothetical protein